MRPGVPPGIHDESNVQGVHESETDVVEADEHHVEIDAADDNVEELVIGLGVKSNDTHFENGLLAKETQRRSGSRRK